MLVSREPDDHALDALQAIPALIAGRLTDTFSLPQIALGYGALALVVSVFIVIGARKAA